MATAGNLVFMGDGNEWFDAFAAKSGKRVWRYNLGAGVNAPPVTYMVNGEQYIAVAAGGNSQLTYPYGDVVPSSSSVPTYKAEQAADSGMPNANALGLLRRCLDPFKRERQRVWP
jgi:hypothetical protein